MGKIKPKEEEINLSQRKLKISEFLLGILVGISASLLIDAILRIIPNTSNSNRNSIVVSFFLLIVAYLMYKKIIGFPDLLEFNYSFKFKKNWNWQRFHLNFVSSLNNNLKNEGYYGLKVYMWVWDKILPYLPFIKYGRNHISRKFFGLVRSYIYLYKKKNKVRFLVGIPDFFSQHYGIVKAIDKTFKDLEKLGIIKRNPVRSKDEYFYASYFSPIIKKGKKL